MRLPGARPRPSSPSRDVEFALLGPHRSLTARGVAARPDAPTPAAALRALVEHERRTGRPAILVGAIPFDTGRQPYLYVPRRVRITPREPLAAGAGRGPRAGGESSLAGLSSLDDAGYREAVARVTARIAAGSLDKVVLARALDLVASAPVDVSALVQRLAADNPAAYTYRVDLPGRPGDDARLDAHPDARFDSDDHLGPPGGGSLVGASPELLAQVVDRNVTTNPLAGSAPRDPDPLLDDVRRSRLADSAKDLGEHRHVVDAVEAALAPLVDRLDVPAAPSISSTRDLWHLSTTVTGHVRAGVGALDVALALHPTPAVCGVPSAAAAADIAELEHLDRGFYSGLVGWVDSRGNGEWVIALRGGHVQGRRVRVHAGAGIVADSDPALEHEETATKMRTFCRSLTAVTGPVAAQVPSPQVVLA